MNKGALLVAFLATKGLDVDPEKFGDQKFRCPFHDDRDPSFSVNVPKGVAHCWSCPAAGDVYELIKLDRGVSFVEAVRISESLAPAGSGAVSQPTGRRGVYLPRRPDASRPQRGGTARRGTFTPSWRRKGAGSGS